MLKKWLSYFIPITIYKQSSAISQTLEVTWANGELVLDSKNTNYSFGSLQRILRKGLKFIGFDHIKSMNTILVLGVGGGSVIQTLVHEIQFKGLITGVEIDTKIVEIANDYFNINAIENLELVIDDAFEFVLKTRGKYDLIIIDVFQDASMPNFLFESFFSNRVYFLLKNEGYILFNTMILNEIHKKRNQKYLSEINLNLYKIHFISKIEQHNELIIIQKK